MKKIVVALILIFATPAFSQTWYPVNQAILGYDAVTKLTDGTNIPAGNTIKYQGWRRLLPATTWEKVGGEVTATQIAMTFTVEGSYFLGVSAIRYSGTDPVYQSAVSGSDVAANCQGGVAFGVKYWMAILMPTGLRQVTP